MSGSGLVPTPLQGGGPRLQGPGSQASVGVGLCLSQIATCSSRNGNPAPQIMWYRNGQPLAVPLEVNSGEWCLRELG